MKNVLNYLYGLSNLLIVFFISTILFVSIFPKYDIGVTASMNISSMLICFIVDILSFLQVVQYFNKSSTNRFLLFDNVDRILLTESNNTQTLIFPNSFKSDTKTVRKIVARELGFICMNIRSHLLEDQYKSSFTKEKIQESNTGGFFGNLMTGLNVIGMITEQSEREKVKKQELDDVWKVASAILVPINAIIVFNKQKSIKKYTHIPELFDVTDDILNTYLVRVRDKIYKYY